jgi:hypothetical protein
MEVFEEENELLCPLRRTNLLRQSSKKTAACLLLLQLELLYLRYGTRGA